jgi:hypothetical protein
VHLTAVPPASPPPLLRRYVTPVTFNADGTVVLIPAFQPNVTIRY